MKIDQNKKDQLLNIESTLKDWDFPPQIVIETTSYCNMRCVHCNHRVMERDYEHMDMDLYKKIINEIAYEDPETEVWPTFYGEAFIRGEELFEMLRYAKDRGLNHVVLNSNGKLLDRKDWSYQILTSGLKRFILSLDGFSKEVFEKIRVDGNRDKIYAAVENLLKLKAELGLEYPVIQCQFSIMDQNQHEAETYREYWESRGAEVKFRNMLAWTNSGDVVSDHADYDTDFRIRCPWGNNSMAIHANGNIVACAVDYEGHFVAGNLKEESIRSIWNGKHFEKLRKPHKERRWEDIPKLCQSCPDWQAVGATYEENDKVKVKDKARPFWWHKKDNAA